MLKYFLLLILIFYSLSGYSQLSDNDTVKAKIVLLSNFGDSLQTLKNYDRVMDNDGFRILIQTYSDCYVYVVSSDKEFSQLLSLQSQNSKNITQLLKQGQKLILPSPDHYYIFNAEDKKLKISLILSTQKIKEIDKAFTDTDSIDKSLWERIESSIVAEKQKKDKRNSNKPYTIAGNVSTSNEEFLNKQQILTSKNILTRTYNLEILKIKK